MKKTNKILIGILLITVMLLAIGYASIQNITLNITGTATADPNQANFTVKFSGEPSVSDADKVEAIITDGINATINVEGLTTAGENVTATYAIENSSGDLSADLSVITSNSNEEYFEIDSRISKTSLEAGETAELTLIIKLIKTPITETQRTRIGIYLTAQPIQPGEEGGNSNGGGSSEGGNNEENTIPILTGEINAEGFMISLDAKNWTDSISLNDTEISEYLDFGKTLEEPYTGGKNLKSSKLVPTSTTGTDDINTNEELSFYRGININGNELHTIQQIDREITDSLDNQFPGYHAIDLFIQNPSRLDDNEEQGVAKETLQLNVGSFAKLISNGFENTGIQNAIRVALAMYEPSGSKTSAATEQTASSHITANQSQILNAYKGVSITDVAIWEPNAGNHTEWVVDNNNTITWNPTVKAMYLTKDIIDVVNGENRVIVAANRDNKFLVDEMLPTYSLYSDALTVNDVLTGETTETKYEQGKISDIYNWDDTNGISDGLKRQIALQTGKNEEDDAVRNFVSIISQGKNVYEYGNESDVVTFDIKKNQIAKVRMYIWLESQDVDCMNSPSYYNGGGELNLNLNLTKNKNVGIAN